MIRAAATTQAVVHATGLRPAVGEAAPLTFALQPGEALSLRGASGAGKSTLLAQLALQWPPEAGTLRLLGACPAGWSERRRSQARARWIGWARQEGNLVPELTVAANVALPFALAGQAVDPAALAQVLAQLALTPLADRPAHTLSYGEGVRAALARLWLQRPPLVLLDEPTAGQDAARAALVRTAVQALCSGGCAVVVATHDPVLAEATGRSLWLDANPSAELSCG